MRKIPEYFRRRAQSGGKMKIAPFLLKLAPCVAVLALVVEIFTGFKSKLFLVIPLFNYFFLSGLAVMIGHWEFPLPTAEEQAVIDEIEALERETRRRDKNRYKRRKST